MARKRLSQDYINWTLTLDVSQAQEEYHKLEKENRELQKQSAAARKAMAQLEAQGKKGSEEWKNLRKSVRGYNGSISENNDKMLALCKDFKSTEFTANQLQKKLKHLQAEFRNTSKAQDPDRWKELNRQITDCKKALEEATKPAHTLWEKFKNLNPVIEIVKGGLWSIGAKIVDQVAGAFKNAASTIMDFESANAKLSAILGTNIAGIGSLIDQAKLLGKTTTFTASQVTDLQTELAKLGFATDAIEAMTPAVLKFSQAVDTDLGSAAAFGGAALRIFGKDAADTEEVLASFALATTKSSLDFSKLETALSTVGPVAASFGLSVEDTTALLGQLANAGFDASSSATATRNILLKMVDSSGDLAKALGGPVHNLDEMVTGFRKLNAQGVDLAKALELTDRQSVAAFNTFLQGADSMITLRDSITGCSDGFNAMSETMTDTAAGAWAGLESAIEGLVLKFFVFRDVLKGLYQGATEVVMWIGEMLDMFAPLGKMIMTLVGALGKFVAWLGSGVKWLTDLAGQSKACKVILNTLVVAIGAFRLASMLSVKAIKDWISSIWKWIGAMKAKMASMYSDATATNLATAATRAFNAALKANPIGLVVSLLAALIAGIMSYKSVAEDAAEDTKALTDAEKEYKDAIAKANVELETQKDKLDKLVRAQNDENLSKEKRLAAINELNRIIPGYNAKLDEETGKVRANTAALRDYISMLEKKLALEANRDYYKKLVAEDEESKRQYYNSWKDRNKIKSLSHGIYGRAAKYGEGSMKEVANAMIQRADDQAEMNFSDWYEQQNTPSHQRLLRHKAYMDEQGMSLADDPLMSVSPSAGVGDTGSGKGKGRSRSGSGHQPKPDKIKEATAKAKDLHRDKDIEIEKERGNLEEADYIIKKNEEVIRYCYDMQTALEDLNGKTKDTDKALLQKIAEEMDKVELEAIKAQDAIDAAKLSKAQEFHEKKLEALTAGLETQQMVTEKNLQQLEITEGEADILRLKAEKDFHADSLAELLRYQDEIRNADYLTERERQDQLDAMQGQIRKAQSQVLTDTGKWSEKIRQLMSNPESFAGITSAYDLQRKNIEATYNAIIKEVGESTEQAAALEQEKNRRLAVLNYEYQEQQWALQENVGLTWQDEYSRELSHLKLMHEQGLLDEKQYQQKRLKLGVAKAKQYFDYYSQLSGSMFSAIQEAEIAASDAKYDVLIRQAKNNGEDTAALEEEKENKKLEIQKKYADVDFAIKISQIIADTAVAIMKAFAQLGPIGGAVSAAMLTATGVAQVVSAKAERDKVKNMQPSATASGSSASADSIQNRVLTGYSEGGYTGDGRRLEVAGVVHKGEYVVPMPIMGDPRVVDAVGMIEAIRRQKMFGRTQPHSVTAGFADGGHTSSMALDASGLREAVAEFRDAARNLRAYVVLKDIEEARNKLDRARAPFTRNR